MDNIGKFHLVRPLGRKILAGEPLTVDERTALVGLLFTVATSTDYLDRLGDSGKADDVLATMWSGVEKTFRAEFPVESDSGRLVPMTD